MEQKNRQEAAEFLSNNLRLRTQPIGVKFLKEPEFPEKTKRPSETLGKRITICQGVTMARVYGWTVGLTKQDLICVPAMIAFGLTRTSDQKGLVGKLFCDVSLARDAEAGRKESSSMTFLEKGEYTAILMAPLARADFDPDTVAVYGNPAQVMRMIQAWAYLKGERIAGNFGGKVECTEYLIAPFRSGAPRVAIPGNGDRIFSMTQDDEMAFSMPGASIEPLIEGLKSAGKSIGAKYPVTFYQNFQPEFPKYYKILGKELGIEDR
ncbi:MAG: DUF169 domain-containing protein [Desulfomonile tiedjei]|uniref:DUF169 domain-containing protein n=1 Tax=Desulfomonile tiedjei TaxID=2358 RepID=A0A9D6UX66_9BACT|nr:DUF169 domain-containing protein [Desulfomonile tiedjei]